VIIGFEFGCSVAMQGLGGMVSFGSSVEAHGGEITQQEL
jgi:hypothetical protein